MQLEFKEREKTDTICLLHERTHGKPLEILWRLARRNGELDVPFHFYVQESGEVMEGRPLLAVAGRQYTRTEFTVYVLIDAESKNTITDVQKKAVKGILRNLEATFPGVQVVRV